MWFDVYIVNYNKINNLFIILYYNLMNFKKIWILAYAVICYTQRQTCALHLLHAGESSVIGFALGL
jgi:hypothetical protein